MHHYRKDLKTFFTDTNNIAEAQMRVHKLRLNRNMHISKCIETRR